MGLGPSKQMLLCQLLLKAASRERGVEQVRPRGFSRAMEVWLAFPHVTGRAGGRGEHGDLSGECRGPPPGRHTGQGERLCLSLQAGPPNQTNTDRLSVPAGATDAAASLPPPQDPQKSCLQAAQPPLQAIDTIFYLDWGAFLSRGPEIPSSSPVGPQDCRCRG